MQYVALYVQTCDVDGLHMLGESWRDVRDDGLCVSQFEGTAKPAAARSFITARDCKRGVIGVGITVYSDSTYLWRISFHCFYKVGHRKFSLR